MRIIARHHNLNIFRHFAGDHERENNVTRALMIAVSRSSSGLILLFGLLELIIKRVPGGPIADDLTHFLGAWDTVEISMQRGVTTEAFLPQGPAQGVLVELAPSFEYKGQAAPANVEPSGIADAVLLLEKNEHTLAVVIESKLYGRAGEEQMSRYAGAMERRLGRPPLRVELAWSDIAELVDALPESAQQDPIIADFSDLLRERPELVSYPGLHERDFRDQQALDKRLRTICQRLIAEPPPGFQFAGSPGTQRRPLDVDVLVTEPPGWKTGNLGLASWKQDALAAKLVVGAATFWQTSRVLDRTGETTEVLEHLKPLASTGRLHVSAEVRVFFHRWGVEWVTVFDRNFLRNSKPEILWAEALNCARSFHRRQGTDEDILADLQERGGSDGKAVVERIRQLPQGQRPKLFGALVLYLERRKEELLARRASEQIELLRNDIEALARLLVALSA